ncbi:hypothetical protein V8G54_032028 [Vigna mungo]|uniref:Benzyl alcohol O-benzoyltransferase n=1 Tax=Vigna mungo TaxID=3915 RepID=A0AAQ3MLB0_VIGMU
MAASSSSSSLNFTVRRCQPQLVPPAIPTPHAFKPLSDIDDQDGLRFHTPMIQIYKKQASMVEKDPVQVIRQALSQTLVFYYPFAGRLIEGPNRKLMVDCTGEGAMFVEADADVTLHQFGDSLQPPFPCFHELLYDVPGTQQITNTPLLLVQLTLEKVSGSKMLELVEYGIKMQVTRLQCGAFILAIGLNHTICDAPGYKQFMSAWAEMARGATKPSIAPVWRRDLLIARDPPRITCNHREFDQVQHTLPSSDENLVQRSFFFGPLDIAALRRLIPQHQHCTTFDLITACLWRCRTKALQIETDEDVSMMCIVNGRGRFNPPLPVGYYGNAFAYPATVTTAGKLCRKPFGYAVELINKVKGEMTEEYLQSVADLMVMKGRCLFTTVRSCIVSSLARFNLREVDFGWGEAVYGGVAQAGAGRFLGVSYFCSAKNGKGEEGIIFPIWLPAEAMERFAEEFNLMLGNKNQPQTRSATFIMSTL